MMDYSLTMLPLGLAAALIFGAAHGFAQGATPQAAAGLAPEPRISGPFTHDHLSIYLIHGPSADGPVPLTLNEALAAKLFKVYETGNVNELAFENLGDQAVFLQSGDIVKGGQQDRVLTVSVVVPAKSGRMPIAAYCVEAHRWAARGAESVKSFDSSERSMPSRKGKLAMMASPAPMPNDATRHRADTGSRQHEVWASVAETQDKLSANLGAPVAAAASQSSLQLSMENEKLNAAKAAFIAALTLPEKDAGDVVGFAFAINGRLNSAEVYPSHALFAKMWGKLIDAAAIEAIGETRGPDAKPAPGPDAVAAFLARAEKAAAEETKLDANTTRVTRQDASAVMNETRAKDGKLVHKSMVAF